MTKLTHAIDGKKLKAIRGMRLKTQKEVSEGAGITDASIRLYEKGNKRVHASTLQRLAEFLEVEPYELLEGGPPDFHQKAS